MKKALMITSVASMIKFFNIDNIKLLQQLGYEVTVVTNFEKPGNMPVIESEKLKEKLKNMNVSFIHLNINRNPFTLNTFKIYKDIVKILKENNFEIIHCQSPVGGVLTRIAARKSRKHQSKVIYTAHGFHFFKGAPLLNWVTYFPLEFVLSSLTDGLITVNKEDYYRAKKMKAKKVFNLPGVGVELEKFKLALVLQTKRKELQIPDNAFVLISVGELNKNKNHQIIIEALNQLKNKNIYYLICGEGKNEENLTKQISEYKLNKNIKLLGFRNDIAELYKVSDVFVFPSKREGLGLAAIEAMAAGLPIITSNVHGINDYSTHNETGFKYSPKDIDGFTHGISKLYSFSKSKLLKIGAGNINRAEKYSQENVNKMMEYIYKDVGKE